MQIFKDIFTILMMCVFVTTMLLMLSSCSLGVFNSAVKATGEATKNVGKGIGYANAGIGIKKLAQSKIIKAKVKIINAKNETVSIKKDSEALVLAVNVLNNIKDEKQKVELTKNLLKAKVAKTKQDTLVKLSVEKTERTKYRANAWFWGIFGMFAGLIFSKVLTGLSSVLRKVEGNVTFNKQGV